jgi:hypothetical protein
LDTLCLDDVKKLIKKSGQARVSIFMPTHQKGDGEQQDPIRLKNLLRLAQEKLVANQIRPAEARLLLKPVESLLTDSLFWQGQSEGLALFIEPDMYSVYHVPLSFKEEVGVADRYYIKPLIPLLSACGAFYVLAISQDEIRLLQCTANGHIRVDLGNTPKNIDEALRLDVRDRVSEYHGGDSMSASGVVQSGPSSRANFIKDNMPSYLGQIAKGVMKIIKNENVPLVLAGVDYIHPTYRKINSYRNLLAEGITGNQDKVSDASLWEQAKKIVRPYMDIAKNAAMDEFRKTAGAGLTAGKIKDVIKAAAEGRVKFLFIADNAQKWGSYNSTDNSVVVRRIQKPEDLDLIELAAYQTLKHDGTIYVLGAEEVPGNTPLAAVLRY